VSADLAGTSSAPADDTGRNSQELPEGFAGIAGYDLAERFATVSEIYDAAPARLDSADWDFLAGGCGEELTLADNRRAFARWQFRPRLLTGMSQPGTATSFLGLPLASPVVTAPFGADRLFDTEGHLAVARANARFGNWSIVPESGSFSLEAVAEAAPGAARMFQLHPMGADRDVLTMIRRAEDAGYSALCLTCDCPAGGWRERNRRNRYRLDRSVIAGNGIDYLRQSAPQPHWTWKRVAEVFSQTALPFMAKGVLTAEQAREAVDAGARALLVSNHGGRQLDSTPASLDQLPEVAAEVGDSTQIALDGGVRRGSDVVKALALGADIVVIGRPAAMALAAAGEDGVFRLHQLIQEEMVNVLTLLGRDISSLDSSALQPAGRPL
jgi:4-hydroxymandelate oxidase